MSDRRVHVTMGIQRKIGEFELWKYELVEDVAPEDLPRVEEEMRASLARVDLGPHHAGGRSLGPKGKTLPPATTKEAAASNPAATSATAAVAPSPSAKSSAGPTPTAQPSPPARVAPHAGSTDAGKGPLYLVTFSNAQLGLKYNLSRHADTLRKVSDQVVEVRPFNDASFREWLRVNNLQAEKVSP